MPDLLVFAPCERVIVNEQDNTISLITLFRRLDISVPRAEAPLAPNAMAPMRWWVLTIWDRQGEDEGRRYEQRVALEDFRGEIIFEVPQTESFQMTADEQRVINFINYFPIGRAGDFRLILSLREVGQQGWRQIKTYPMLVNHIVAQT